MNLKESDVFIFKEPIDVELLLLEYRKHVKFCLKQSFYVGLPFSCDQDLVFKFKQLFAEFEKDGQIFFYFSFKPHQSIRSIIDESSSKPRWSNVIHLLPDINLQYGTYKEELWDLHLEQFSVYFHEIDSVKVFSAQIDLITKLNARGGIIGITATGLSIKKITQLIAENSINFCNSVNLDIHSKEYSAEMASRREIEELIFNSRSNV